MNLTYEEAISELEKIISELENENCTLNEVLNCIITVKIWLPKLRER